jgi:uncharacterized membrane protein
MDYNSDIMQSEPLGKVKMGARLSWKVGLLLVVSLLFLGWLSYAPPGLLGKADALGYAVCHRLDARSFHLGERQLPLCARCSGMYLGAVLGLVFQSVLAPRKSGSPPVKVIAVFVLFFLGFAIDGGNSFLSLIVGHGPLYEPSNTLRLFTGTGMGLGVAAVLYPALGQTIWQQSFPQPALVNLRITLMMVFLAIGLDLLVLSELTVVLYFLALISAAGVLLLLTLIYTMMLVIIFHQENRYSFFLQLWPALLGGLLAALTQVFASDILRFAFTKTWGGFPLG